MNNSVGLICTFLVNVQNKWGVEQTGGQTVIACEASLSLTKSTRRKEGRHMNIYRSISYIGKGTGIYLNTLQQEDKSSVLINSSENTPNEKNVNDKDNVCNIIRTTSVRVYYIRLAFGGRLHKRWVSKHAFLCIETLDNFYLLSLAIVIIINHV